MSIDLTWRVNRLVHRAIRLISPAVAIALAAGVALVWAPPASALTSTEKTNFVSSIASAAQTAQRTYGVPASVSIAQAAYNSTYGTATLAKSANNYFANRCTAILSASQFAALAEKQVGKRYILGAEAAISNPNPSAFDCSELVEWLYGRSGNKITDLAAAQYNATVKATGSVQPGDLVFLRNNPARSNGIGHVAVITKKLSNGDWRIIEAKGHAYGVVRSTLSYWKKRSYFTGVRRYPKLNFAGQNGVIASSSVSAYQSGCVTMTSGGVSTKYRKYSSGGYSVIDHAATVATGSSYAAARSVMNDVPSYVNAIAKAEYPKSASSYAAALRSIIAEYSLTRYDVVPLTVTLTAGQTGPKITALQYLLKGNGVSAGATGTFDAATVASLKNFQSKNGLYADGRATAQTLTELMITLNPGNTHTSVYGLKALLAWVGYATDSGSFMGPKTVASLKAFQVKAGLSPTGVTDSKTWSRLFMLVETAPTPLITGTTTVGKALTAKPGTWGPGSVNVSYQWYREGAAISGAVSPTYTLQPADAGKSLTVATTGSRPTYTSVTRESAATPDVVPATLTAKPVPKISGAATIGHTLTAVPGAWAPSPVTLTYQWYRNGTAISGATNPTYLVSVADFHAQLKVAVVGAKAGYYSATTVSAATTPVAQGRFTATPAPKLTGQVRVGGTLTATVGTWSPAPSAYTYQWFRDGYAIKGATKASYAIPATDAGHTLMLRVTGSNPAFVTTSTYSAKYVVSLLNWTKIGPITMSGWAKPGKSLSVKVGTFAPAPTVVTYQWYRSNKAVKGATRSSYAVSSADRGRTLRVTVTVRRNGYTPRVRSLYIKVA